MKRITKIVGFFPHSILSLSAVTELHCLLSKLLEMETLKLTTVYKIHSTIFSSSDMKKVFSIEIHLVESHGGMCRDCRL